MEESATRRNQQQGPATRTADRSLALLRVVAESPGATLTELARAVDLPSSTTLRHLRNLELAAFVQRDDAGRYAPGEELRRIARAVAVGRTLPELAQPYLDALAAATGETCYLAVAADRTHATYVATAPGRHAIRHASWLGGRVVRRASAVGAALAGRVGADGVAVRHDAVEPGVTAIASPVRDPSGTIVAALSVVGPSFRLAGALLENARSATVGAGTNLALALAAG